MSSNGEQNNCDAHLQAAAVEIDALKQALLDKQTQLLAMESACLRESNRQVELEDSVIAWQDKYDRLYESHKRVQKVNQSLEDKLLKLVDRNTGERAQLTSDVATLSVRLAQANYNIAKLQREIERYKADINLAIQLLQCKPDSFVPQKVSSLPIDIQSKVSSYMRLETNSHSDSEGSTSGIGVATSSSYKVLPASDSPPPACPFPPTAMVFSMRGLDAKSNSNSTTNLLNNTNCNNNNSNNNNNNSNSNSTSNNNNNNNSTTTSTHNNSTTNASSVIACSNNNNNNNNNSNNINSNNNNNSNTLHVVGEHDMISPSIMAKFLEEELKASEVKHCDTCHCSNRDLTVLADVSRSYSVSTQTPYTLNGNGTNTTNLNEPLAATLCLRCNSNLNSPSRTNSPYLMKLVKSSDSVISETKSSVSDLNDVDKLFTPAKRDDLMVNPILGHHRLCERTAGSGAQQQHNGHFNSKLNLANATTSLGNYQPSDVMSKYIMEPSCNTPPFSNGNGYQRRFIDGGGTALDLIELRTKYDVSNTPKLDLLPQQQQQQLQQHQQQRREDINGMDELEDESKPLLSGVSQQNLHDHERKCELDHTKTTPLSACGSGTGGQRNNLLKTTISGSVNSLWSKTSSCEGAKMFENFNRNLIKTIKAENPKYRGPRLCAMRIQQNGQSNILLDNIESIEAVTPIVYTRRERFLDEELDDTKDIITSKLSVMSNSVPEQATKFETKDLIITEELVQIEDQQEIADSCAKVCDNVDKQNCVTATEVLENIVNEKCSNDNVVACLQSEHNIVAEDKTCNVFLELKTGNADESLDLHIQKQPVITHEYTASEQASDRKLTSSYRGEQHLQQPSQLSIEQQQQLLKATLNYDALHQNSSSCKNSQNSKSYTQSSSISDVIDFQESVMLRRQQLSRVAEWVQNNSQQLEQQQQQQQQQLPPNVAQHCTSSGAGTGTTTDSQQQSSYSTLDQYDSISMEKLSMDSGYKTTPQPQTNGYVTEQPECVTAEGTDSCKRNNNNTYYRRTGRSGLPIAYNTAPVAGTKAVDCSVSSNVNAVDSNSSTTTTSIISPEQPTCDILNYKYYPSESDRTLAIKAELHTTTQHVDIAQMEYNVKQFLLKQNEWSIRNSRNAAHANTTGATVCSNSKQMLQQHQQIRQQAATTATAAKAVRHSKLFGSTGIGPGVGERVKVATIPNTVTTTATAKGVMATAAIGAAAAVPHRTETNL